MDATDGYVFRFGVSPAPELFQARMHDALAGVKGVACIADDILIARVVKLPVIYVGGKLPVTYR